MKFKKIFALGFAAFALALASCSNDELEGGDLNPTESGKGYLTVAFTTNTNSSRAVVDDNTGDGDGSSENSGHTQLGTTEENTVNSVLVLGVNTANPAASFTQYYTNIASDFTNETVQGEKQLTTAKAIEVATGTYDVNVIVNPSSEILGMTATQIKEYAFKGGETLETALAKVIGEGKNSFMMSGRESSSITVAAKHNTEANAATGSAINVERVVSKIAFRPTKDLTDKAGNKCPVNVYPIQFTHTETTVNTTTGEATSTTDTENWYVKIERYALVNLSKDLYAVRHKSADFSAVTTGGTLGATDYIVDPNSAAKNALTISSTWTGGSTYFFQTLSDITNDSKNTSSWTYFQNIPDGTETNNNEDGEVSSAHNGIKYIGTPLSYCFENSVKNDKMCLGLSTGIAFQAKIYKDKDCTQAIDKELYKYAGNFYTTLANLKATYKDDAAFQALTESSTDEELEALGIAHYKGGNCYYYTSQIKHYDNGDNTTCGVMEFAIMRNNIYSLAVESIDNIGEATLKPFTPNIPDEEPKTYIKVSAKILPWIVRFNNIKF